MCRCRFRTEAFRLRCEQEAEARRDEGRARPPAPVELPSPTVGAEVPARSLPDGPLHAPKLRPDAAERRLACRRSEDLLLD